MPVGVFTGQRLVVRPSQNDLDHHEIGPLAFGNPAGILTTDPQMGMVSAQREFLRQAHNRIGVYDQNPPRTVQ